MKELNKLITKDIFNCLSEEDAERLVQLRQELNLSEEMYERMKKSITSRTLHEEIVMQRRTPRRIMVYLRYAAVLVLPLAIAAYFLLYKESKKEVALMTAQNQEVEHLPAPARKQPKLILGNGEVVSLERKGVQQEVAPNAVNTGNELVYTKDDTLKNEMVVEYNTIIVPKCGEYNVTLADGTRIFFNEETELKFPVSFTGENREVFLAKGEIYLQVVHDEEHPFIVHTVNGDIRVLGTEFNVRSLPDNSVATTLVNGKVQVKRGNSKVILKPNQQAVVGDVVDAISILNVDVEDIICWKDNMFSFKDVELETIMNKLAEWYGFAVFYEAPSAKNEKFFVRIDKYAEVNKILEVIAEVGDVKFKINGKTVSVYK